MLCLILLVSGAGLGYYYATGELGISAENTNRRVVVNTENPEEYEQIDFSLFWEVWSKLEREYLEQENIDHGDMVYGAIRGMVASLGDPYTAFLPPREQQRAEEDLSGAFQGVGIQLGYIDNQLAVIAPLRGMPAEAEGVQAGDYILHIKDETRDIDTDTQGMSLPDAVEYIRGRQGVPVTLTLYRDGELQPFDVTIRRDTIVIPSVELEYVENSRTGGEVAHLILSRFGDRTEREWNDAVTEILDRNDLDGIVLDLRNNPGGYLQGSVFIASEFIPNGLIVTQEGRTTSQNFTVNRRGRLLDWPIVVLVNRGSASASEIVAGAMRDRLGVQLVGTNTFGKGTVQSAEDLRFGTGLHITTARWLLPSGDKIPDTGLEPDIEATFSAENIEVDEQLEAAILAL